MKDRGLETPLHCGVGGRAAGGTGLAPALHARRNACRGVKLRVAAVPQCGISCLISRDERYNSLGYSYSPTAQSSNCLFELLCQHMLLHCMRMLSLPFEIKW